MADKIILERPEDWDGLTLYIPDEIKLTGETLGPLVGELTDNGVIFLRSLNKSGELIRVGYVLLNGRLDRHEANGRLAGYKNKAQVKWANHAAGCRPTPLTIDNLRVCAIEKVTYDVSDDVTSWFKNRSPYEQPEKPKPKVNQPAPSKAPPPPSKTEDGWVMI
jgi:hypothetical protein